MNHYEVASCDATTVSDSHGSVSLLFKKQFRMGPYFNSRLVEKLNGNTVMALIFSFVFINFLFHRVGQSRRKLHLNIKVLRLSTFYLKEYSSREKNIYLLALVYNNMFYFNVTYLRESLCLARICN